MRRLLLALVLFALSWWTCRDEPTSKHSGLLVYWGPEPDSVHWRMYWLDLATGKSRPLDYWEYGGASYNTDRSAVWFTFTGTERNKSSGVLRVGRAGSMIATRYYANTYALAVAPDEKRAVIPKSQPGSYVPLLHATVTAKSFVPGELLGVDTFDTTILGWFPWGSLARHVDIRGAGLVTLIPGQSPHTEKAIDWEDDYALSHDGKTLAAAVQRVDRFVVRIGPLDDPYEDDPWREVVLGVGDMARCTFSPDDTTLGCELAVGDPMTYTSQTIAIDVATGKTTRFSGDLGSIVFSPDSRSMIVFGESLTILSVDNTTPPKKLPVKGAPVAWIR